MGYTEFYNFLIPLYGLSLGMSAGQIGMLLFEATYFAGLRMAGTPEE
jgi:hypothetical protein